MLLFRLEFAYQFYQYESVVSPSDCECDTFEEVLNKIPEYVKVRYSSNDQTSKRLQPSNCGSVVEYLLR